MTEYEAVYLFKDMLSDAYQMIFSYVGLIYGFLVISYLIAHKLNRVLTLIALTLYTVMSLYLILSIGSFRQQAGDLYAFIEQKKISGTFINLDWFGEMTPQAFNMGTIIQQGVLFGVLIGSLIFFFYRRKQKHIIN